MQRLRKAQYVDLYNAGEGRQNTLVGVTGDGDNRKKTKEKPDNK